MRKMLLIVAFIVTTLAARTGVVASQHVFDQHGQGEAEDNGRYVLDWPVKDVAIIGAGVSGLLSYRALVDNGNFHKIRIFERDSVPGGNWHYTSEVAESIPVSRGNSSEWWKDDYTPSIPILDTLPQRKIHKTTNETYINELERIRKESRQPKPIWKSLKANTPAPQQQIPQFPWPPNVLWATPHDRIAKYLKAFASWLGVNTNDHSPNIEYDTRVERVKRNVDEDGKQKGWILVLHKFVRVKDGHYEEIWWQEHFDAVIVATGRFNIPYIPSIRGLAEWQKSFPKQILHSRQYRSAENWVGKNVLVVGASASATGISEDINPFVGKSYLSIRESSDDPRAPVRRATHLAGVPSNTSIVGEIKAFHPVDENVGITLGEIELVNGTIITGIDAIVFGTGYKYAFPFLEEFHLSSTHDNKAEGSKSKVEHLIVTDGTHLESLYLDTFYIDQPTLTFQGQNVGIQTFIYGKYTGTAIASVWSKQAHLPSTGKMWKHYWDTVRERGGLKKGFQWLNGEANDRYLRFLTAWINGEVSQSGQGEMLDIPPDLTQVMDLWQRARGIPINNDARNDFNLLDQDQSHTDSDSTGRNNWNRAILDNW